MYKIKAMYDGTKFLPSQPILVEEAYEVLISFFEPMKVLLLPHDEEWIKIYDLISRELNMILGNSVLEMYHIGSTAIKNILSKPVLDIAVVVNDFQLLNVIGMDKAGYDYCGEREPGRYLFVKQRQYGGIAIQHIHCYQKDNDNLRAMVLFCKYLNEHPEYAKQYNDLKLELTKNYPNDRWLYSSGKSNFIKMIINLAMDKYCSK